MKYANLAYLLLLFILLFSSCEDQKTIDFTSFGIDSSTSIAVEDNDLLKRMDHYHVPGLGNSDQQH